MCNFGCRPEFFSTSSKYLSICYTHCSAVPFTNLLSIYILYIFFDFQDTGSGVGGGALLRWPEFFLFVDVRLVLLRSNISLLCGMWFSATLPLPTFPTYPGESCPECLPPKTLVHGIRRFVLTHPDTKVCDDIRFFGRYWYTYHSFSWTLFGLIITTIWGFPVINTRVPLDFLRPFFQWIKKPKPLRSSAFAQRANGHKCALLRGDEL